MAEGATNDSVVIERTFNVAPEVVWKMWTEPEHFAAWYGPTGASIPVAKIDARVGGKRLVCMEMQTPNGPMTMWFTGEHLEVSPVTRLVYTESMCDKDGNILSPAEMGMPAGHPTTTEVIIDLVDLGGGTKLTLRHVGIPAGSPGATGWVMALDKLGAALP